MSGEALVSTKLLLPAARPGLVARPRLIARLNEGLRLGRGLSLVSAPPGFGKTTLIREWAAGPGRPAAWISLDEHDNDAGLLARYIVQAINGACDAPDQASGWGLDPASPRDIIIALINVLAGAGTEVLLVLDDYHVIHESGVHDLVAFLLANRPRGLHLAIGTREDPPLPLARLRARDQVTEVREPALRFTAEEAGGFFRQTMDLRLPSDAVSSLVSRTEGWVTGLQLAGLALRQRLVAPCPDDETRRFVTAFAGDDRYIIDYLMGEVLERAPASVRDFLRQTCILDRLSAPLCDELTGRDDSQMLLDRLEAANLFVVSLDNRREWYRYHVLFAEALRLTLRPAERGEMHRKAARWFQANGWGELAMRHAQLAAQLPGGGAAPGSPRREQPLVEPLSEREIEVLRLVAEGYSNAEIAKKLYIATGTVKRHINNIYGKLDAGSRTQAIAKARAIGILG